ncbi:MULTISPECIES: hypothetical protein [Sporosarcina]|nr:MULTISPECIES: hypothetical protein [Sporosarcina]
MHLTNRSEVIRWPVNGCARAGWVGCSRDLAITMGIFFATPFF